MSETPAVTAKVPRKRAPRKPKADPVEADVPQAPAFEPGVRVRVSAQGPRALALRVGEVAGESNGQVLVRFGAGDLRSVSAELLAAE